MAQVTFKKGLLANLADTATKEGQILITTDERAIYLDISDTSRIRLGDFQEVANIAELASIKNANRTALYYAIAENILCKWDGTRWVQINKDTGITSITFDEKGTSNGFSVQLSDDGRTATIQISKTLIDEAALNAKIGQIDSDTVKSYVDTKIEAITGTESTLTSDVNELKETVGNASSGLVKEVNDLKSLNIEDTYATKAELNTEKTRIDTLQTSDTKQNSQLTTLETTTSSHDTRITALEGKLGDLSGAMHFKGVVETDPTKGLTDDYKEGDVVVWGEKEYVYNGTKFIEFGDVSAESGRITALETWKGTVDTTLTDLNTFKNTTVPNTYATKASLNDYATKTQVASDIAAAKTALQGKSTQGITVDTIGSAADAVLAKALAALEWGTFGA